MLMDIVLTYTFLCVQKRNVCIFFQCLPKTFRVDISKKKSQNRLAQTPVTQFHLSTALLNSNIK